MLMMPDVVCFVFFSSRRRHTRFDGDWSSDVCSSDLSRTGLCAYTGLESQLTSRLLVDVGGRYENYSDFGSTVNGKLAGRYELGGNLALRGAVSTGFRAPSLQQVWLKIGRASCRERV